MIIDAANLFDDAHAVAAGSENGEIGRAHV